MENETAVRGYVELGRRKGTVTSPESFQVGAADPELPFRRGGASRPVLAVFAIYGLLWGPYLALLPELRRASGAGADQYSAALLVGAVAALPAMYGAGRLVDRWGRRCALFFVGGFAVVAMVPPFVDSVAGLFVAVVLFGCGSGACNVVAVAMASAVESASGGRVMNRAHALFPLGLLASSVLTGAFRAAGVSAEVVVVVLNTAVLAGLFAMSGAAFPARAARPGRRRGGRHGLDGRGLALSCLAALALVVESGVQQWSAMFLDEGVHAAVGLSAAAPGVFAGAMALGRFGGHWVSGHVPDRVMLMASGAVSACGVLVLSAATGPGAALGATALVGAGISVAPPTAYGIVGRRAAPEARGAAVGSSTSLANVGLLLGPALVGQAAGAFGLRTAIAALALVALAVSLLAFGVPTRPRQR